MRRSRLIYLIFATLLLFNGYDRAFGGMPHGSFMSHSVHDSQNKNISGCNDEQGTLAFLPDTDWDDDDENYMPARKKASFHEYFAILESIFLYDLGSPTVVNSSRFSENYFHSFPARYIFQRVLRI